MFAQLRHVLAAENSTVVPEEYDDRALMFPERAELGFASIAIRQDDSRQLATANEPTETSLHGILIGWPPSSSSPSPTWCWRMGRLPGFRMDRTGAAIIGASLMVGVNALSLSEAQQAINFDTIILLFGMMIVVANLQLSGFFSLVAERVVEHAHRPLVLLIAIVAVAGFFSAFFVNDTMCLVLTPLVLEITDTLGAIRFRICWPWPWRSNIGSVATITGNPQNMMIGSFSGIPYRAIPGGAGAHCVRWAGSRGARHLFGLPRASLHPRARSRCAAAGSRGSPADVESHRRIARHDRHVLRRMARSQSGGGSRRAAAHHAPRESGKGLSPHRLEPAGDVRRPVRRDRRSGKNVARNDLAAFAGRLHLDNVFLLSAFSAVLSNLVSNVPAVLVFKPFVGHLANPTQAWLTLAMSSTLAGNLTVLGSVANLIVIQQARHKVKIGFWEYFRVGAPLAILTILIGGLLDSNIFAVK